MSEKLDKFKAERERLNELALAGENTNIKRFFALDNAVYREGALSTKTKEMLGLVASTVLRCNDCIFYHIDRCYSEGITREELDEVMAVALIVGGSITIPHVRQAYDMWNEIEKNNRNK